MFISFKCFMIKYRSLEKYTVQNIHFKIINHKNFSSFPVIDENFYG